MEMDIIQFVKDLPLLLQGVDSFRFAVVVCVVLCVWFIPTITALLLRRKNLKFVLMANALCIFSHFLWFALLIWVFSGRAVSAKMRSLLSRSPESVKGS